MTRTRLALLRLSVATAVVTTGMGAYVLAEMHAAAGMVVYALALSVVAYVATRTLTQGLDAERPLPPPQ